MSFYHWDKVRQKAIKFLGRLQNEEQFVLVVTEGVLVYALLQNYVGASQEIIKLVQKSISTEDPRCQPLLEKIAESLKHLEETKKLIVDMVNANAESSNKEEVPPEEETSAPEKEAQA